MFYGTDTSYLITIFISYFRNFIHFSDKMLGFC